MEPEVDLRKKKVNKFILLFLNQNICCGYSKEPSHLSKQNTCLKWRVENYSQFYADKNHLSGPMMNTYPEALFLES